MIKSLSLISEIVAVCKTEADSIDILNIVVSVLDI